MYFPCHKMQFFCIFVKQSFDMKVFFYLISFSLLFASITACSVGRYLDSPAYIMLGDGAEVILSGESQKYLNWEQENAYLLKFNSELVDDLEKYNIITSVKPQNPDRFFSVNINKLTLNESFTVESIITDSLLNGSETYYVTSCSVNANFDVYSGYSSESRHVKSADVNSNKDEKLNNNRTFFQILFGTNKDNSQYHYNELNENVFEELCLKSAAKSAAKISRIISKELK